MHTMFLYLHQVTIVFIHIEKQIFSQKTAITELVFERYFICILSSFVSTGRLNN